MDHYHTWLNKKLICPVNSVFCVFAGIVIVIVSRFDSHVMSKNVDTHVVSRYDTLCHVYAMLCHVFAKFAHVVATSFHSSKRSWTWRPTRDTITWALGCVLAYEDLFSYLSYVRLRIYIPDKSQNGQIQIDPWHTLSYQDKKLFKCNKIVWTYA